MRRLAVKRTTALAVAITLGVAAGAFAYWAGSGSGSATTVLSDAQALHLEPGTPTYQLYPGGDANVVSVVSNPNKFFAQIGRIVLDTTGGGPFTVDGAHSGCDVSVLSFIAQDNGGAGWRVPPRTGSTDGTLAIDMPAAMKMSVAAANACQGASFTVALEARS
jgi:hypothetical protein